MLKIYTVIRLNKLKYKYLVTEIVTYKLQTNLVFGYQQQNKNGNRLHYLHRVAENDILFQKDKINRFLLNRILQKNVTKFRCLYVPIPQSNELYSTC